MGNITLLSDMGLRDTSVAVARGILMQQCPQFAIADITHDITPFNTKQAAYLLGSAFRNFPAGTFHCILFDLFPARDSKLIISEHEGHFFLAADNGVLPLALGGIPGRNWQPASFHAHNLQEWLTAAAAMIKLLEGNSAAGLLPYTLKNTENIGSGATAGNSIDCEVIHIDRYENVVLNMTRSGFQAAGNGRQFRLQFMQTEEINEISHRYEDVRPGYKLARFNSNGYLEICINRGKAASLFGLRLGARNNDIKLVIE